MPLPRISPSPSLPRTDFLGCFLSLPHPDAPTGRAPCWGPLGALGKRQRADWAARRAADALRAAGLKREARPAHPDAEQLDDIELRIVRVTQPREAAFPNAVVLAGAHGDRAAAQVPSKPMPVR